MSDIIQLKNPQTNMYCEFKKAISKSDFTWHHHPSSVGGKNPGMFSHTFLRRPEPTNTFPMVACSGGVNFAQDVIKEILYHNDITVNSFYRINVNMVYPQSGNQQTLVHVDHPWPHNNILIYFSNEGKTILENDEHDPKEDDVIIFPGLPHCHELPKNGMRMVLVATYLSGYDE